MRINSDYLIWRNFKTTLATLSTTTKENKPYTLPKCEGRREGVCQFPWAENTPMLTECLAFLITQRPNDVGRRWRAIAKLIAPICFPFQTFIIRILNFERSTSLVWLSVLWCHNQNYILSVTSTVASRSAYAYDAALITNNSAKLCCKTIVEKYTLFTLINRQELRI